MTRLYSVGVIILGAGRSARMGRPKLLLPWGETSVLGHLLEQWRALGAEQVAVVCAAGDVGIRAELDRLGVLEGNRIGNPAPERGMFSSIQCAAQWPGWQAALTHWAIVLGDQPHLQPRTLRRVLDFSAAQPAKACQPARRGHGRHPVVLPKALFRQLAETSAATLKDFLAARPGEVALCEVDDPGMEVDIDRPEDYDKAVDLAAHPPPAPFPLPARPGSLQDGPMTNAPIDLKARAHQAMVEAGFQPDFPPEVLHEVQLLKPGVPKDKTAGIRDLRSLLWSSIDNDSSRDLDQVEYVEKLPDGTTRLLVGIADVDASVPKGSATDRQAAAESTSVYTGVTTFPMLPGGLSTDLTSLLDAQDRLSLIIEMWVAASGEVERHEVYPAWLRNCAKLAYSSTGAWLEGRGPMPPAVAGTPGMEAQLRLQQETSEKLSGLRKQHGALTFGSIEATPVVENGEVKDLVVSQHNVADDIIESFMVAANTAIALLLKEKGSLSIRRVVRTPKRWDGIQAIAARFGVKLPALPDPRGLSEFLDQRNAADPVHFADLSLSIVKLLGPGEYIVEPPGTEHEGHFGLAVQDYTHSTAPNRRYADLVTQRLLKATLAGGPGPYAEADLSHIAAHCTEREDAARKVERLMRKVAAASLLVRRIGEVFDGVITGASPKGTYVRLLKFPAEGRVVRGTQGIDVGDKVQVRLASVDVAKGFIDFERR